MNEPAEPSSNPADSPGDFSRYSFSDFLPDPQQQYEQIVESFAPCLEQLAQLQVEAVTFSYDGYGDEGMIESVTATAGERQIELPDELEQELTDAAEELLPCGWENGEGAFGELVLDVSQRRIIRQHSWRISETHYEEEGFQL